MRTGIRLRRLLLRGLNHDYGPSLMRDGRPAAFGVIAGEISTGKTSILEFIDFCLGGSEHPTHPEIAEASVHLVLLELEVNGEVCVIERATFPAAPEAVVHWTDLDSLGEPHDRVVRPLRPAGDPESLSTFLLDSVGLAGLHLKEAPTQAASGADPLSFRDLMGLCFLSNERLGSRQALYENDRMRSIKLRQVVEAVFGVHEDALVELSATIAEREKQRDTAAVEANTLRAFLDERKVPEAQILQARDARIDEELDVLDGQIDALNQTLRSQTTTSNELRARHAAAAAARERARTVVRDRETFLNRLHALRGQYAADIARLSFSAESQQLFDDLQVMVCPACRNKLPEPPAVRDAHCTLCGQAVMPAADGAVDFPQEMRATHSRLEELTRYIASVTEEIGAARATLGQATATEERLRSAVDEATAPAVAPFLTQRDQIVTERQQRLAESAAIARALELREGLAERQATRDRLGREVEELNRRLANLTKDRRSRDELVSELSVRFSQILGDFGFPKLSGAYLNSSYVPHVRDRRYGELSSGARTLATFAWALAIMELAVEQGHAHPGFLLVDGVQKNLTPPGEQPDPEVGRPEIVDRMYAHLIAWTGNAGREAQVVLVDNRPPRHADGAVVVRYTADAEQPPYGLIEDATK
jgi:hypothetical protein